MPRDLDACHRLIEQLAEQREELSSRLQTQDTFSAEQSQTALELEDSRRQLRQENDELKLTLRKLMDRLHGRRSERFVVDPNQLPLDLGDDEEAAQAEALSEAVLEAERAISEVESRLRSQRRKQKRAHGEKFPDHLPRYEKIVDLPEEAKAGKTLLGYDQVETLEFERPRLRVRVTKYAKYAGPQQPRAGVQSPERPTALVEGDRFDTSVAVEILAARFFYHLP